MPVKKTTNKPFVVEGRYPLEYLPSLIPFFVLNRITMMSTGQKDFNSNFLKPPLNPIGSSTDFEIIIINSDIDIVVDANA